MNLAENNSSGGREWLLRLPEHENKGGGWLSPLWISLEAYNIVRIEGLNVIYINN